MRSALDFILGFLGFLLNCILAFAGLLIAMVGFVMMIGGATAEDWLIASVGVAIFVLGIWLQERV